MLSNLFVPTWVAIIKLQCRTGYRRQLNALLKLVETLCDGTDFAFFNLFLLRGFSKFQGQTKIEKEILVSAYRVVLLTCNGKHVVK